MHDYEIWVRYADTGHLFGWVRVNRPVDGQYIRSVESCQTGAWADSDLSLPAGIKPGGTVFYDADKEVAYFRLSEFKASSRDDTWGLGATGTGFEFSSSRKLKWEVTEFDDKRKSDK
jgi:hypothetical protein